MKKVSKILLGILEFVIIAFAVLVIVLEMGTNEFGFTQIGETTFISIDDENITELDTFKEGDLVTLKEAKFNDIKEGDTVYYYATLNNSYIIVYGTVKVKDGNAREAIYVFEENPDATVTNDRIIGKLDKAMPGYGNIYDVLTSTVGFLLLVILPILVIFIYQVYNFIMLLKEDKHDDMEEELPKPKSKKDPEVIPVVRPDIKRASTPAPTPKSDNKPLPKLKPRNKE